MKRIVVPYQGLAAARHGCQPHKRVSPEGEARGNPFPCTRDHGERRIFSRNPLAGDKEREEINQIDEIKTAGETVGAVIFWENRGPPESGMGDLASHGTGDGRRSPLLSVYFAGRSPDAAAKKSSRARAGFPGKDPEKRGKTAGFFRPFSTAAHRPALAGHRPGRRARPPFVLRRRLRFSTAALWRDQPSENRGSGQNPHDLSIRGAKFEVSSNRGRSGALSGRFPQGAVGRNCRSRGAAARVEHAVRRYSASSATDGARFPQKFSTGCGNVGGKTGTDLGHGRWGRPAARGVWKRFGKAWVFLWFFLSLLSFAR